MGVKYVHTCTCHIPMHSNASIHTNFLPLIITKEKKITHACTTSLCIYDYTYQFTFINDNTCHLTITYEHRQLILPPVPPPPSSPGQRGDEASITKLVPAFLDVMDLLKNLPDATRSPSLHTPHTLPGSRPVRSILKKTEKAQVSSPGPPRALGTSISPGHVSSVVAQGPRPPADSVYKRSCTESHQDCPGCVSVPLQQSPGCVSEPRHPQDSTTSC